MRDARARPLLLLTLTIVGAIVALGLINASARRTYRTLEAASARQQSAYEFLMALRLLRQHVGEARVGVTGYLLTRDPSYRATYLNGIAGFRSDTIALRNLGDDQPTLVATLARLGPALAAYEGSLAKMAQLTERRPRAALEREVRSSRDFVLLDEVRRAFLALEAEQKRLMAVGGREVTAAVQRSNALITLATVLGVALLLGAGATLGGQVVALERVSGALEKSEKRFREMATYIKEVFFEVDLSTGRPLYVSPTWSEVWGRPIEDGYDPDIWFDAVHENDRAAVRLGQESVARGEPVLNVFRVRRPDGSVRWLRGRAFPVRDVEGRVYRMAGVSEDITELRQVEERFLQAQKMEAVGRLAGGVAHDFNNLLTVIFGQTDLTLAELPPDHSAIEALRDVRDAAKRAAALTQQLLAFSRQQLVEPVVFNLNEGVTQLENIVRRLIGEDVEVILLLAPEAGSVKADRGQFEQLLMNLAVNARDAMPQGGRLTLESANVTLDDGYAKSRLEVQAGDYVMLAVSDTGTGMTDEVKARIFEPFFTTKELGKGTGLGLATCFGIVKQAGGHLSVYSEVGVGTTFRVYLPRVGAVEQKTVQSKPLALPRGRETILLVEDDESVRTVAVRLLEAQGYSVLQARDGEEAMRTLQSSRETIDLLITDVVLPKMGGRELAEQVQAKRPGIAVLFASGYTEDIVFHHKLLDREVALLHKPFTRESIARKVREVLDGPHVVSAGKA
jgi:PAS domain S-box-containing protein